MFHRQPLIFTEEEFTAFCAAAVAPNEVRIVHYLPRFEVEESNPSSASSSHPIEQWLFERGLYRTEPINAEEIQEEASFYHECEHSSQIPYVSENRFLGAGRFGRVEAGKLYVGNYGRFFDMNGNSDDLVACKELDRSASAREYFEREVKIMNRLLRRGLFMHRVQLLSAVAVRDKRDEQNEQFFLFMEPVANEGTLDNFLQNVRRGRLSLNQRSILTRALGCLTFALAIFHDQNVLHRDIHGGNILIHNKRILYSDFGSTVIAPNISDSTSSPFTAHTAPELAIGSQYNKSTDAFALGEVLLEIFQKLYSYVSNDYIAQMKARLESDETLVLERLEDQILSVILRLKQPISGQRMTVSQAATAIFAAAGTEINKFSCSHCRDWMQTRLYNGSLRKVVQLPLLLPDSIL